MNVDAILRKNEGEKLNGGGMRICTILNIDCNTKFDHLYKVEDRVISFSGRAIGL